MTEGDEDEMPPTYSEAVQVLTREIRHKYGITASNFGPEFLMGNSDIVAIFPPHEDDENHGRSVNQSPSAVTSPTSSRTGNVPGTSATHPTTGIDSPHAHQRTAYPHSSGVQPQRHFQHHQNYPEGAFRHTSPGVRERRAGYEHPGYSRREDVGANQISDVLTNQTLSATPSDSSGHIKGRVGYPQQVSFEHDNLEILSNCTQTDVNWKAPANADLFSALIYRLQVMMPPRSYAESDWEEIAVCKSPLIRVYRLGEVLIINKKRFKRLFGNPPKPFSVIIKLRIRAEGIPRDSEVTRKGFWNEISLQLWRDTS